MTADTLIHMIESAENLEDLALLINSIDDYYPVNLINDIIRRNGWEDISDSIWGIARDPRTGDTLMFDDHTIAYVSYVD